MAVISALTPLVQTLNGGTSTLDVSLLAKTHYWRYLAQRPIQTIRLSPFFSGCKTVSIDAWDFGEFGSCDEQCIGFTGNHKDKQLINYKKEGDGFLADSICEEGYTYSFFFRNQPAPAHYLNQGFSPTHSRV
jgi:hypothetical protein